MQPFLEAIHRFDDALLTGGCFGPVRQSLDGCLSQSPDASQGVADVVCQPRDHLPRCGQSLLLDQFGLHAGNGLRHLVDFARQLAEFVVEAGPDSMRKIPP